MTLAGCAPCGNTGHENFVVGGWTWSLWDMGKTREKKKMKSVDCRERGG
jgi:hypothetical protein